jgi:hypothetical protein
MIVDSCHGFTQEFCYVCIKENISETPDLAQAASLFDDISLEGLCDERNGFQLHKK